MCIWTSIKRMLVTTTLTIWIKILIFNYFSISNFPLRFFQIFFNKFIYDIAVSLTQSCSSYFRFSILLYNRINSNVTFINYLLKLINRFINSCKFLNVFLLLNFKLVDFLFTLRSVLASTFGRSKTVLILVSTVKICWPSQSFTKDFLIEINAENGVILSW